jgi:hypothetical protein
LPFPTIGTRCRSNILLSGREIKNIEKQTRQPDLNMIIKVTIMNTEPFKVCTSCGHVWPTMESFLTDPELRLAGYQAHFEDLTGGLFIFTHVHDGCGTSMALPVKKFIPLTARPILSSRSEQPGNCPGLCMREGCFDPCPEECECNWVRETLWIIKFWPRPPQRQPRRPAAPECRTAEQEMSNFEEKNN